MRKLLIYTAIFSFILPKIIIASCSYEYARSMQFGLYSPPVGSILDSTAVNFRWRNSAGQHRLKVIAHGVEIYDSGYLNDSVTSHTAYGLPNDFSKITVVLYDRWQNNNGTWVENPKEYRYYSCGIDDHESASSNFISPTPVIIGMTTRGIIAPLNDRDVFEIKVIESGNITIDINGDYHEGCIKANIVDYNGNIIKTLNRTDYGVQDNLHINQSEIQYLVVTREIPDCPSGSFCENPPIEYELEVHFKPDNFEDDQPTGFDESGDGPGIIDYSSKISSGNHTLLVQKDGTVLAWGNNSSGQLGNGTMNPRKTPSVVADADMGGVFSEVITVASGNDHSLALKSDGTVWAWGNNDEGQLGDNTNEGKLLPIQVLDSTGNGNLTDVKAIFAGQNQSMAIKTNGSLWIWGSQYSADPRSTSHNNLPVQVDTASGGIFTNVFAVAGGGDHTIALKADRSVWAWGSNSQGQLGDGSTDDSELPVKVQTINGDLSGVSSIDTWGDHNIALKTDGTVWTWGNNSSGQLGIDSDIDQNIAFQVLDSDGNGFLNNVTAIGANSSSSFALKNDGTLWAWGAITNSFIPKQVIDQNSNKYLKYISFMSVGRDFVIVIKKDGSLWSMGDNYYGQLGNGFSGISLYPVQMLGPDGKGFMSDVKSIAAGDSFTLLLKSDGTVYSLGHNRYGVLGTGIAEDSIFPMQVVGPDGVGALEDIIVIDAGYYHSIALKNDGTVWTWGNNLHGNLGNGNFNDYPYPVQVKGLDGLGFLKNIISISAGLYRSFAVSKTGYIYAWGDNRDGALGIGNLAEKKIPTAVVESTGSGSLSGIIAVAAGYSHTMALTSIGEIWGWGDDVYEQLNGRFDINNNHNESFTPVKIQGLNGIGYLTQVSKISAGVVHSVALKNDGSLWSWGGNYNGQIGNQTIITMPTPVQVLGESGSGYLSNIKMISANGKFNLAVSHDGNVFSWGKNYYGQLGNGFKDDSDVPNRVIGENGINYLSNVELVDNSVNHAVALKDDGTVWGWGRGICLGDGYSLPGFHRVLGENGIGYLTVQTVSMGNETEIPVDANKDGIPDNQQDNVTTIQTYDGQSYVIIESPEDTVIETITSIDSNSFNDFPMGVDFPYGLFSFRINNIPAGNNTTVKLTLPDGANPTTYYKYGTTQEDPNEHWYEFLYDGETGAEINGNVITLHFVDGKRGDNDLNSTNGSITDPGGPGVVAIVTPASSEGGGGGGGGGCFINLLKY